MPEIILDSSLRVPAECVPLNALGDFQKTIKDKDGEEINLEFYRYDSESNIYIFAKGNMPLLQKHFGHLQWKDLRTRKPMKVASFSYPGGTGLKFSGQLRPNQQEVADSLIQGDGWGQLCAAPRFGKTITMAYLTCHWQQKTLFLCHQQDLSEQIYTSFVKFTNLLDAEFYYEKPIVGIVSKWDDLEKFDVAIMTYQKFVSGKNADEMLEKYRDAFGVVWIDEVHKATATCYSNVVSAFNAAKKHGVSGTIERKNKMHVINEYVIGPVVVEGKSVQLPSTVQIVKTGVTVPYKPGKLFFTYSLNYLTQHEGRNQLILSYMEAYARAGHFIVAATDRSDHCELLAQKMRERGITAQAFHSKLFPKTKSGDKKREQTLQDCRDGTTQILIAQRSMLLGVDVPRWTAFFCTTPSANAPNFYQEICRVRTPFEGKPHAYMVDFVDSHHILEACYKTRHKVYVREGIEIKT
jgi:superfamily II DNA or RNA helicase